MALVSHTPGTGSETLGWPQTKELTEVVLTHFQRRRATSGRPGRSRGSAKQRFPQYREGPFLPSLNNFLLFSWGETVGPQWSWMGFTPCLLVGRGLGACLLQGGGPGSRLPDPWHVPLPHASTRPQDGCFLRPWQANVLGFRVCSLCPCPLPCSPPSLLLN